MLMRLVCTVSQEVVQSHSADLDGVHPLEEDSPAGSFQDPGAKYSLPSSSLDNELGAAFKVPANLPEDINGEFEPFCFMCALLTAASAVHAPVGTKPRRSEKTRPNSSNDIATGEVFRNPKLLLDIGNEQLQDLLHKGHPLLSATSSSGITSALDVLASSEESALSSPPESPVVGSKEPSSPALSRVESSNTLLCPMCKVCVDRNFFETFEGGGRKNVRSQARFCRAHKVKSAREEWSRRGYPEITWTFLPARIKKHHSHLRKVLSGKIPSSYRESLEATIKTGKNRTLRQSMLTGNIRGLTPGYYGSRGARVMYEQFSLRRVRHTDSVDRMEGIMSKFSSEIRKLAATDKTISSGGVSNYVQAVLVPELAVLLVKEDMGCDDDAAKNVLKDSIDIGDLLNEEQDDEIRYDVLAAESE